MTRIIVTPSSVRFSVEERAIFERIQNELGRPGLALSMADAVKVALHEWALTHPGKVEAEV